MGWLSSILEILPLANDLWSRYRYGARVELQLEWRGPPVFFLEQRIQMTRTLNVTVTAPKREEYVVVRGHLEVQIAGRWHHAYDLERWIDLPWVIPANRSDERPVNGPSVADALPPACGDRIRLRVVVSDHHRQQLRSSPVEMPAAELRQRKVV